jgi:5-hydroxyisourate hydrolase-like protein (transthyretin family)
MKHLLATVALLALCALPAVAANGGISGTVINAADGTPAAGVRLAIYRMPVGRAAPAVAMLRTDRRGRFADIGLPSGRYAIVADMRGRLSSCTVHDDVIDGEITNMQISVGAPRRTTCSGQHVYAVPMETRDVYVIH